jgi:hypothetical protein
VLSVAEVAIQSDFGCGATAIQEELLGPLVPRDVELRPLKNPTRHGGVVFITSGARSTPLIETFTQLAREVFAELRLELKRRVPGLTTRDS